MDDAENNMTVTYSYDGAGNILLKSVYEYTTESLDGLTPVDTTIYLYENSAFKDQLTSCNGMIIEYDALGNPLSYLGWTMSWVDGRRLSEMSDGTTDISFKYDEAGIRTSKTINGITTTYTTINGQITSQNDGTNLLYFRYDKNGSITGINVNGTEYLYVKNAQGDVIEIIDMEGNSVVYYSYDAWGKVESISGSLATTLGVLNPMRYRGYYEDTETGLYYLQSRYYDAEVGRFVSVDELGIMGALVLNVIGSNLYCYCYNNPLVYSDSNGSWSVKDSRKLAKLLIGNPINVYITQNPGITVLSIFYLAGFTRDSKGVYHARQDCLQRFGGYNDFYDEIFRSATYMDRRKFEFNDSKRKYVLWAWKGNYLNLGAGAEMGIYTNKIHLFGNVYISSPSKDQWLVDRKLSMKMAMKVKYTGSNKKYKKYKGKNIITYGPGKFWWITGFNPYIQGVKSNELSVTYTVYFNDKDMYYAFFKKPKAGWKPNLDNLSATYEF